MLNDPQAEVSAWMRQVNRVFPGFGAVFSVTLLALFASKGLTFFPSYAVDDLTRLHSATPGLSYVAQGRFVEGALAALGQQMRLGLDVLWWPALVLLFPVASAVIAMAVCGVARGKAPLPWLCLAGALAATAPAWTDVLLFRTALPAQLAGFCALGLYLLGATLKVPRAKGAVLAAAGVVVGLGAYQPFLGAFAAIAAASLWPWPADAPKRLFSPAVLGLLIGVPAYLAIAVSAMLLFGVAGEADTRGGLLPPGEILDRVAFYLRNALEPFGPRDRVTRGGVFILLMVLLGVSLLAAAWRSPSRALAAILVLAVGSVAIMVPPLLLRDAFLPGRTLMAGGLTLALALALLGPALSRAAVWGILPLGVLVAFLQAGASSVQLLDQQRANRWDLARATAIARDVLAEAEGQRPAQLILVGHGVRWGLPLRSVWYDRNPPALHVPWSAEAVFREATGEPWAVQSLPTRPGLCEDGPKWPEPGAILRRSEATFVCMRPFE